MHYLFDVEDEAALRLIPIEGKEEIALREAIENSNVAVEDAEAEEAISAVMDAYNDSKELPAPRDLLMLVLRYSVITHGSASKLGHVIRTWKTRYLFMKEGSLNYYDNQGLTEVTSNPQLKGEVALAPTSTLTVDKDDAVTATLVTSGTAKDNGTLQIRFPTDYERDIWCREITEQILIQQIIHNITGRLFESTSVSKVKQSTAHAILSIARKLLRLRQSYVSIIDSSGGGGSKVGMTLRAMPQSKRESKMNLFSSRTAKLAFDIYWLLIKHIESESKATEATRQSTHVTTVVSPTTAVAPAASTSTSTSTAVASDQAVSVAPAKSIKLGSKVSLGDVLDQNLLGIHSLRLKKEWMDALLLYYDLAASNNFRLLLETPVDDETSFHALQEFDLYSSLRARQLNKT